VSVETTEQPIILHQGRYRLYRKPDNGLHLVYQRDDKDEPDHMDLPGAMVAIFDQAAAGNLSPVEMIKAAMNVMKGGM
jgi:hypothetical protein